MEKKHYGLNVKRFRGFILSLAILITLLTGFINLCLYPEKYSTTCKFQLENDLKCEDPVAIDFYNSTYVERGYELFEN